MTQKVELSLDDFLITFKVSSKNSKEAGIQFYVSFFNRYPELINDNTSDELYLLFVKLFPKNKHLFQLQDNAQKFVDIINKVKLELIPENYRQALQEESILYIHSCARVIFDFIFETTNQDYFVIVDNLIDTLNQHFDFNDYIIPWYDYTEEKLDSIDFELSKMHQKDSDKKFLDYFKSLSNDNINFVHRSSDKLSLEDDLSVQKILSEAYFKSNHEEQNLLPYLLHKINKENNHSLFEIHSFIPINEEYAVNFIFTASIIDNQIVFGEKNPLFFNLIAKSLGAYFSKTTRDSNLFIRAINPTVEVMTYNKDLTKQSHQLNEIYGFFFNEDFSYGLKKDETKKILEQDLYTLKYKKPKPGTFYSDASDIFSYYATDKAISLILGDIKIAHHK